MAFSRGQSRFPPNPRGCAISPAQPLRDIFFDLSKARRPATMANRMPTILVVDDDPAARKPMARLLKMEGYDVVCAENAVVAMAEALARTPDLILLDVSMPPMDGLTFLFLLRERACGRDVPVIVISGRDDDATIARAKSLGVCEYLVKTTYRIPELLELIRYHCLKASAAPQPPPLPTMSS